MGLDLQDWRVIDADDIKVRLLDDAQAEGRFAHSLSVQLPDGYPVMLNELSTLVHVESTVLANLMVARSVEAGENVIIAGTLSWPGLVERYLRLLSVYDYREMTVVDVEVTRSVALEQAQCRWWEGRLAAIEGGDSRGGRFTPEAAITSVYENRGAYTRCNVNAVDLFTSEKADVFDSLSLRVHAFGAAPQVYRRVVGDYVTPAPRYLRDQELEPSEGPTARR